MDIFIFSFFKQEEQSNTDNVFATRAHYIDDYENNDFKQVITNQAEKTMTKGIQT